MNAVKLEKIIIDAKRQYNSVFTTLIGEDLFVWRLLTQKEMEIIDKSAIGDKYLREELICEYAVIYPDVIFSTWKAGIPTMLAPHILEESGFGSVSKIYNYLDQIKEDIEQNFITQASIAIASAFPQYKFEEIEEWDIEKFLQMAAKAEWKLAVLDNKPFSFQKVAESNDKAELSQEEQEAEKAERLMALEDELINMGADPILCLYEEFYKKKKPYTELPFIMGSDWKRKDVCDAITKSLSKRISNK